MIPKETLRNIGISLTILLLAIFVVIASFFEGLFSPKSAGQFIIASGFLAIAVYRELERLRRGSERDEAAKERIEAIETRAEKEPEKVRFAWELAQLKLEQYFDRNLTQLNYIFWISVFVMIVGFGVVVYGITNSFAESPEVSYLATVAGIITEFIGATFMLIYRSTVKQASTYTATLERINSVGMAVQILDSIPDGESELKNRTKSELVCLLLGSPTSIAPLYASDSALTGQKINT